MSLIHIARNSAVLGQFPEEEVRSGLTNGTFLLSDLAWRDGMPGWQTLSQWPEFSAGAATIAGAMPIPTPEIPRPDPAPAWEHIPQINLWKAFWQTVTGVLLEPSKTFSSMPKLAGIGKPYGFYLIGSFVSLVLSQLIAVIFGDSMTAAMEEFLRGIAETTNNPALLESYQEQTAAMFSAGNTLGILMALPLVAIYPFIAAGISHLCLIIVGGAKHRLDATFRVSTYTRGVVTLLAWIPVIGGLTFFLTLALDTIGLAKVHEISYGRAALAVFGPLVLCCFCCVGSYLMIFLSIAAHAGASGM